MTLAGPDLLQRGGLALDVDGARATLTLSRPGALNAQTPDTWLALAAVGTSLPAEVRVVVVRGEGRAFSAGLDRSLFAPTPEDPGIAGLTQVPAAEADARIAGYQAGFTWLRDPARVTVAAVQGHAIGAGFQLALACDLRVVADDVQFCMAETTLGIVPDLGGTLPLVRAVGYARAVDLCLTGRRVGAEEAAAIGLAQRVVPRADLDTAVDELVAALLAPAPGATAETLALLAAAADAPDPAAQLAAERAAQLRRLHSLTTGKG